MIGAVSPDPNWRTNFEVGGFAVVPHVLDDQDVAALRLGISTAENSPPSGQVLYTHRAPPSDTPCMIQLMNQWFGRLPSVPRAPSILSRLGGVVAGICGEPMVPFQDVALVKLSSHAAFPWHADLPYWPIDSNVGVVTWIALDSVSQSNGAVRLAAGSHRCALQPAVDLHLGLRQDGARFELRGAESHPSLDAGDLLVFDARTAHCSGPNSSDRPRRAWAISWVSATARWDHGRVPRHPLNQSTADKGRVLPWSRKTYLLAD